MNPVIDEALGQTTDSLTPAAQEQRSMARKGKLLFFITEDWFVCSHWLPHVTAARDAGYQVFVVTRVREHRALLEQLGIELVSLELSRRGWNPLAEAKTIAQLFTIYQRIRPDLVHHIAMKPVVYGTIAAWLIRPKAIVNYMAGLGWLFTARNLRAQLLRLFVGLVLRGILRSGQVIVENPSDWAQIEALGIDPHCMTLVPGAGVDMQNFFPVSWSHHTPLVIMASRLLWAKGVGEFVAAARLLKSRGVTARFALVGNPDPENPSSVPIGQLEVWRQEGVVEWWGRRNDMPEVFAESHVVCLPSTYGEGVPKVLIEASAAGRPIIATQIPGCQAIVRHGENGLLVPLHDIEALARAMETLINDRELRERMGQRGREIALIEFSEKKVVALILSVYDRLLQRCTEEQ
jgi:glycosyltransferase involved in cell wall biosynthesis